MGTASAPRFTGKVVVVTGASSGIGEAAARAFAAEGAAVAVVARTASALEKLAADIHQTGGQALAVPADVGDPRAAEAVFGRVVAELGGIDALVNNAGAGPVDTGFIMAGIDDVPDLVFSQPMSTAEEIAAQVLDSAADGTRERTPSRVSSAMTTIGYLFPSVTRRLTPLMERRGRTAKRRFQAREAAARSKTS